MRRPPSGPAAPPPAGASPGGPASARSTGSPPRARSCTELLAAESSAGDDGRAFNLKLAFCRYLAPEARLGLLERRRAQLVEQLARYRTTVRTRRERMDTYMQSVFEHDTEATERDISWLDALIATEKQRAAAAPPEPANPIGRRQET